MEKICTRCGKHCVPVQSYCPKCGSALPAATPSRLAPRACPYKVTVNKGSEEHVLEFEDIEQAFNGAMPWIAKGYIARITDEHGVVKWAQAVNGLVVTYDGDANNQRRSMSPPRKPWWRFW